MKGASFVRHLISITFVSFWYTSKYRWYINSHKSKREKNCYLLLIMSNLETFMHGELLGVGARIFCWASTTGLKNLPRFLVTFVDMLRNYVTFFKSKSVIRMSIFSSLNRVQIWYQNNNKHSPLTLYSQRYWKFAIATRRWGNIVCCPYALIGWILKAVMA